ncbi:bacteriophage T4 gp5 trimerization domain-containing protein [Avibacterium gallinarum]|uniref:bacteriophage T4 gp5 trimerisation domain-containing protein n=1 Tax=Avibacterium gallinarum TaxID=755 RepID=UPI003BF8A86D
MHIKSKTYKGEGYNSILFEDAANRELFEMHALRDMTTLVEHDQKNHIKNHRTLTVNGSQRTQIDQGRTTQITTGNDIKTVLAGNNLETISLLKAIQAKEIFNAAHDRIELEVGKQTSLTMDNEKILLRFGKNTILMNEEGIWLDGVHIGMQETEVELASNQSLKPIAI